MTFVLVDSFDCTQQMFQNIFIILVQSSDFTGKMC